MLKEELSLETRVFETKEQRYKKLSKTDRVCTESIFLLSSDLALWPQTFSTMAIQFAITIQFENNES